MQLTIKPIRLTAALTSLLIFSCNKLQPYSINLETSDDQKRIESKSSKIESLQPREEPGLERRFLPNSSIGYTGWSHQKHQDDTQFKEIAYYENGLMTRFISWLPNGQKVTEMNLDRFGNGNLFFYYKNGKVSLSAEIEDFRMKNAQSIRSNGSYYKSSKIIDGNGSLSHYDLSGREMGSTSFKNGIIIGNATRVSNQLLVYRKSQISIQEWIRGWLENSTT